MADYELIALNEAGPDLRAPTSADRGVVAGGVLIEGLAELDGGADINGSAVVDESYLGTEPEQSPLNQFLGSLAYYDHLPMITVPNVAPTIASAATIIAQSPVSFVSGTTNIDTIQAPMSMQERGGQITLIPTGLWATTAAGNIALATTAVVSKALTLTYDSATAKWYPSY